APAPPRDGPGAPPAPRRAVLPPPPWVRPLGKLACEVTTQGWRFPVPPDQVLPPAPRPPRPEAPGRRPVIAPEAPAPGPGEKTRLRPPRDAVQFKDRLLYLLQPPLEDLFGAKHVPLPLKPYP